jgi:hypothetical protein
MSRWVKSRCTCEWDGPLSDEGGWNGGVQRLSAVGFMLLRETRRTDANTESVGDDRDGVATYSRLEADPCRQGFEGQASHLLLLSGSGRRRLIMDARITHEEWFRSVFGADIRSPGSIIATSWAPDTKWGHAAHCALINIEVDWVKEALTELRDQNIPGHIAEFGVFMGWWVNRLWELTEEIGFSRDVYGFDSFKGLSDPHPQFDGSHWKKGQYECSLTKVRDNVRAAERSRIKLVEGFFADSLQTKEAQSVHRFCFARIDCDIYEPALQVLRYLGPRLSDKAILVFDDWPFSIGLGEQRAFSEWLPEVPHLKFEFLFYNTWGHLYLRVHHVPAQ